ncbi:MAG: HAMP domain-containing histidine kinase [Acidobacteria bacterium]|nr:HAMP domain-containing histidine kinase [Acidobacteriota bacterium]
MRWMALGPLLLVASNVVLAGRCAGAEPVARVSTSTLVGWIFALDMVCLTGLLMLGGGPSNPFTLLYLVHITLAATILKKRQTWLLGGLSTLCFALLFWIHRPVPQLEMHYRGEAGNLHLIGMWISFAVAVLLVALYSARISELLREHEEALLRMQEELAKKDRLASLVTLSAGAAHELNTPLSTIAVVAKELERFATNTFHDEAVAEDSRLIRREVERCREILSRMSVQGAEPAGQAVETVAMRELLKAVCSVFQPDRILVERAETDRLPSLAIPRHAVEQALVAVVKNAVDASPATSPVRISVRLVEGFAQFIVTDRGKGMSPETLRRIGEPFFTTKEPGKGMGLGTFLARTLAERLGGRLTFQSSETNGTTATLELPVSLKPQVASKDGVLAS